MSASGGSIEVSSAGENCGSSFKFQMRMGFHERVNNSLDEVGVGPMAGAENGDGDRSLTAQVIAEIER